MYTLAPFLRYWFSRRLAGLDYCFLYVVVLNVCGFDGVSSRR